MSRRMIGSRQWEIRPDGITIDVAVRAPMDASAYHGWSPEQIRAFLDGIGKVVAAAQSGGGAAPEETP